MRKFSVTVVFSYIQTIEVTADNKEDAKYMAWESFDVSQSEQGEGAILDVHPVNANHSH
jgi:hypothetical protein